jgi:serine/threonine-protein kinase RsbW
MSFELRERHQRNEQNLGCQEPKMSSNMPHCEFDAQDLVLRLETIVPADVTRISPVVEQVMELARQMECTSGKEFEIETALREALANAIVHGCKRDPCQNVQLCVGCDQSRGMLIIVRNPGEGFDPSKLPNPTRGRNLHSSHGRGIFLITQLMDEVHFEHGGTEIRMRKQ